MNVGSHSIRIHRPSIRLIRRGLDLIGIAVGLWMLKSSGALIGQDQFLAIFACASLTYLFVAELLGLYAMDATTPLRRELGTTYVTWFLSLLGMLAIGAITQYGSGLTRSSFTMWGVLSGAAIGLFRVLVRMAVAHLRSHGYHNRGFAVVGITEIGVQIVKNIQSSPELGLRFEGFFDDRGDKRTIPIPPSLGRCRGSLSHLIDQVRAGKISVVYITLPMRAEGRIRAALNSLSDTTASVYLVPDFFVFEMLHARWNNILGIPAVSVFESPFYGVDGILKRAFDVVTAIACLVVAAIPMVMIGVLVKLSSPGPILFRQRRYGLDGREIHVWKFRTMTTCDNGPDVQQARAKDPRVTPIGSILRRTSLDELPQLFNVIEGSMSLVGPRPHATAHNEQYRRQIPGYMLRHKVKPGITGLAQVNGWRGETDTLFKMEKRIEFDHRYIREWTFWMDVQILCKTVAVVLSRKNAY